jgi:hypothetical protein
MIVRLIDDGDDVGGLPKDSDAKYCIETLVKDFGWTYKETTGRNSHPAGFLLCSENNREGCRINVASTGQNTAKKMWRRAKACTHGDAPNRSHW